MLCIVEFSTTSYHVSQFSNCKKILWKHTIISCLAMLCHNVMHITFQTTIASIPTPLSLTPSLP